MSDTPKSNEKGSITAGQLQLPPFYNNSGIVGLLKRAQERDPEWRHRMVNRHPANQAFARDKGWVPIEDAKLAEKLGFPKEMINGAGRIYFMDCELWRMPVAVANMVREHLNEKYLTKRKSAMKEFEAVADDVRGRSGGKVDPFASLVNADVPDRT